MIKLSLRQLQVFVAIASREHVTQAAESLALSQSATSMALAELEAGLGLRLFDRQGKQLRLNVDGARLLPEAIALLERAEAWLASARTPEAPAIELRLAASLTIGNYLLPGLIAGFRARYPQARVELALVNSREAAQAVRHFRADLGFIEGFPDTRGLKVEPWREDELALFAGPEPRWQRDRGFALDELLVERWVLREPGSGTRQVFERALGERVHRLCLSLELTQTEAIIQAVKAGLGIGCLPRLALADALAADQIRLLSCPELTLRRSLSLLIHPEKYESPGLALFLAHCRQAR